MEKIVGNSKIVSELKKIIKNKSFRHAYMFSGVDGIGKFLIAKEFAKSILCLDSSDTYCSKCEACNCFEASPDFVLIEPEDGLIKVDSIRTLAENIMLKPTISSKRVFIIRDAECMNESAQNALLKILEEPPLYATIILITSNKEKILRTIKSRCTILEFNRLTDDEIKKIFPNEDISDEMLSFSNGSAGKYLKLKRSDYTDCLSILEQALNLNDLLSINRAMDALREIKTIKEDIYDVLDLLIIKLGKDLLKDSKKKIGQIEAIETIRNNLEHNANFDTSLDYLAIKLWEINSIK